MLNICFILFLFDFQTRCVYIAPCEVQSPAAQESAAMIAPSPVYLTVVDPVQTPARPHKSHPTRHTKDTPPINNFDINFHHK